MEKNESGFSLFELMIVIAIISILAAIAVPNFIVWRESANLRGSAFNLKSDLELAKMRAIRGGENVAVAFTGSQYEVFQDTDGDFIKDPGETVITAKEFQNITIIPVFDGNPTTATGFNSRGQIARVSATNTDKLGTVTLKNKNSSVVLTVNRIGLVSIQ